MLLVTKIISISLLFSMMSWAVDLPPMIPQLKASESKKEEINININGLEIADFIRMVSKITEKNILVSFPIKGKIEYISAKPIYKENIYELLITILETYGFTVIDSRVGYLNVVRSAEASQMNLPFDNNNEMPQMMTKTLKFKHSGADLMANKVRHLLSKSAKLIVSKENNSLVISDYPQNLKTVEDLAQEIDTKDETTTQYTKVVQLKNTEAKTMVATLNNVISKKVLKPGELRANVTNDDNTNTIIVTATEEDFKEISSTIAILDAEREQVYVKAKIVEISDKKSSEIGLKYGVTGGIANDNGLFTLGTTLTGSSVAINDSTVLSKISIPSFTKALAVGVSLSLLAENGATNTLSEPSLLCVNNQESTIYVGQTESIKTGTTTATTGVATDSYSRQDIGLTLKLKPRVSNDNKVNLTAEAKLEDIVETKVAGLPTTTKREVKTNAIVNSGESVIIGGLIKNKESNKQSKVPFFGDIPLLGALFRSNAKADDKTNLVVILTPYIVKSSDDLSKLNEQLAELDKVQQTIVKEILSKDKK